VTSLLTWLSPAPQPDELPAALNNPFREQAPPPLAERAARGLMKTLREGEIAPGLPTQVLYGAEGGKMFGVLVVEAGDGRVGALKAFSGQLERRWDVEGFVPPVFDRPKREAMEPRGEAAVRGMTARVIAAKASPEWLERRAARGRLEARHTEEGRALKLRHDRLREAREAERARLLGAGAAAAQRVTALDRQSRADETEHRREKTRQRLEREDVDGDLRRFERRLRALERLRRSVSRIASWELYDTYSFENALGRKTSLRALFAPTAPPSGAGDCAAPKLLIFARRQSLRPLALAEFWWGAPPRGGGRAEGVFFPACREKCGTVLPFLLEGLAVEP
jgi:tRNA pseudouridine32 synthase / 23S rRNA pseudouridine746 synthase